MVESTAKVSEYLGEEAHEAGAELIGICIPHELVIYIIEGLPYARQQEVLWHEVCHAVQDLSGNYGNMDATNEDAIGSLATLQLMVLRDNPGLVFFLLGNDNDAGAWA